MSDWNFCEGSNFGFFAGVPHEVQLMEIVELSRDSSGKADLTQALALSAASGHNAPSDYALLSILVDNANR